jgi:anthranilate synthase component 1
MPHLPHFETFAQLAAEHDLVPVYRRLIGDSLTPVSAFHKIDDGGSACLFESVIGGEKVGRYSFLASQPSLVISAKRNTVTVARVGSETESFESPDPIDELRKRVSAVKAAHLPELPPFTGGAVGFASYDVIRYSENLPNAPEDDRGLPDLSFAFYDHMIVFDNVAKTVTVVVLADVKQNDTDMDAAYRVACRRVDDIVAKLAAPAKEPLAVTDINTTGQITLQYESNFDQPGFEQAVRKCVEYIRAGDIFQVVISQRLQTPIHSDPFEIYRTLRIVNPSPFMFFLRTPETTLVGSSPEVMVRVVDGRVTVRPLAGTRPRGANEAEDRRLGEELLADEKERAEHVMLVDLGRNDVGRVAKYRSVQLSDAMRACLPAGTVSGAPKVRAMEIIDEIEPHRRGPYAGAVGYIDYGGNMDTCIALRTIVIQHGVAYVQAGAGIVADSDPTAEYQETLNKARGLLKAIEITERRTATS